MSRVQWAEVDFDPPPGAIRLLTPQPADGKTYVMYHGTTQASAQSILARGFRQSKDGMLGRGVYLSRDLEKASRYPIGHPEWDKVVIKVKVNVGKVKAITKQNHPLQKTWHDHGYDTAWVPPNCGMTESGLEEDCVWDPRRIVILGVIYPFMVPVQVGYPAVDAVEGPAVGDVIHQQDPLRRDGVTRIRTSQTIPKR
uniref:PARP catalytic domain-containing protein n=1 Tax=Poecilia mexicana TaxID=48701 RepID=A0A3B3YI77_9TELE